MNRYLLYLTGGAVAAIFTVVIREVIALLLPADTPPLFLLSIVLAYLAGTWINFSFQKHITFQSQTPQSHAFARFLAMGLVGMGLVALLSYLLRYPLGFDRWFGNFGDTTAFAVAVLLTSVFNYLVSSHLVFGKARAIV